MGGTVIHHCGCDSMLGNRQAAEFQDRLYGKGIRSHNRSTKQDKLYRCSLCGKERTVDKK